MLIGIPSLSKSAIVARSAGTVTMHDTNSGNNKIIITPVAGMTSLVAHSGGVIKSPLFVHSNATAVSTNIAVNSFNSSGSAIFTGLDYSN